MIYTDIGHDNPNDLMWIIHPSFAFEISRCGDVTHKWVWGKTVDLDTVWRGRYEVKTGLCSITPPDSFKGHLRLPAKIKSILNDNLPRVSKYYFFPGADGISPNPKSRQK